MYILVLSDTHLDTTFEPTKYEKLKLLIEKADHVILNGDFWEGYGITFDELCNTEWTKLFPLLKSKKTVYVFGNHDKAEFSDQRIYQFCDKATEQYRMQIQNIDFIFEHGHRFATKIDGILKLEKPPRIGFFITEWMQKKIVQLTGPKGMWILFGKLNHMVKSRTHKEFGGNGAYRYICGHTHCIEVDTFRHFANSGFSKYGYLQYLTIDEKGVIKKHTERY